MQNQREDDKIEIQNDWTTFQEYEIQNLLEFIDLENSLFEELDSLVLVSKDSSAQNLIQNLFNEPENITEIVQETLLQETLETPKLLLSEGKCNCKSIIQALNQEIKSLSQSIKESKNEKMEFMEFKRLELENISRIKLQNSKEIKREIKELEKLKKASCILPSKKERLEIENLKKTILQGQEEFKQKEIRYILAQDRFKRRIDELTKRNSELLEQVKVLERDRANYINVKKKSVNTGIQTLQESVKPLIPCKEALIALSSLIECLELPQPLDTVIHPNKKVEYYYENVKLVWYPNGTLKENYLSGKQVIYFVNGDKKTIMEDESTIYWYAQPDILHTTLSSGLEVYEFPNGQVEKRHKDGTLEIHFPDSTVKYVYSDGQEKVFFPNGTVRTVV